MFPRELPHTPHDAGVWTLALAIIYLLFAWIVRFELKPPPPAKVFDAAVFATSVLLLCGVIDDRVAKALGDTTSFLIIAGLVGVLYSIGVLGASD
jgi:hypothetical protein